MTEEFQTACEMIAEQLDAPEIIRNLGDSIHRLCVQSFEAMVDECEGLNEEAINLQRALLLEHFGRVITWVTVTQNLLDILPGELEAIIDKEVRELAERNYKRIQQTNKDEETGA